MSALIDYVRVNTIDMIIVALPLKAEGRVLSLLKQLWVLPVNIRLTASSEEVRFSPKTHKYVGNVPLFNVFDSPMSDWDYILKAIEDRVLSAVFLVLLAPLMLIIAILVKLDSRGPVLFKQKRYGFNNELIEVYKFRSLRHDQADANAIRLVTKNDDRVTRIGRIPAQDQPRRTAAAHHRAQGRHVDRRPTAPCACRPRPATGSMARWWTAISRATG